MKISFQHDILGLGYDILTESSLDSGQHAVLTISDDVPMAGGLMG